jgi:hypothetical protein
MDSYDLAWIGQLGLDKTQPNRLMILFKCPIHRSNKHIIYHCSTVKWLFTVSNKTSATPGGPTDRDGGTHKQDDRGGHGRGRGRGDYQRHMDSNTNGDHIPTHAPKSSSKKLSHLGNVAQSSEILTPPVTTPPVQAHPGPIPAPASSPIGDGFEASLTHTNFTSLASPTQMFDPTTYITMKPAYISLLSLLQVKVSHPH